ncbi:MAG: TrbI/VirB10 family protein [Sediminimonas qiaohouensis]|uniref:TrbI/VirB10 family protein n=1 Tax=Sediminimonas qiaohouensis TaxID=552061 RepID=A0A7C9HCX0_9RHOB|nr:TrbI/VirB10 family protein [Sediminimonas qiaohouensis]
MSPPGGDPGRSRARAEQVVRFPPPNLWRPHRSSYNRYVQGRETAASQQGRLLLVWTRLILPDGRSIVLERAPGTDGTGASGLKDRVNYHWGRVFLAAGLATILNLGLESGAETEDDVARAIHEAAQDTIGRTGEEIVRQQLAAPPTLTIRPGFPVRVMVTRDLILEPLGEVR